MGTPWILSISYNAGDIIPPVMGIVIVPVAVCRRVSGYSALLPSTHERRTVRRGTNYLPLENKGMLSTITMPSILAIWKHTATLCTLTHAVERSIIMYNYLRKSGRSRGNRVTGAKVLAPSYVVENKIWSYRQGLFSSKGRGCWALRQSGIVWRWECEWEEWNGGLEEGDMG